MYVRTVNVGLVLLELARSDPDRWTFWWDWALEQMPLDRMEEARQIVRRRTIELQHGWHAGNRAAKAHLETQEIALDSCVLVYTWFTQDARFVENILLVSDGQIFAYRLPNAPDVPGPMSARDVASWVLDWRPADPASLEPYEVLLEAGRAILQDG